MLKLFYLFLSKSLSGSYKKQTILKPKLLLLNLLKFKLQPILGLYFFSLVLCLLLFATSCNTTEPPIITPPPQDLRKITLTFEDASCTEVWLKIKADSLTMPAELTLKQYIPTGDSLSQIFVLNTQDSVLYIDSLLPNQTYNYQAVLSTDTTIKSEKITAQTLEPTSHNFTWQTWEFGQHSSSVLYDVVIIDENNIWAVGEIYMNDSLGNPDPILYNVVKWDGHYWKIERVYYNYQGSNFIAPLHSVLAFSVNDVWVGSNQPMHWINNKWEKWDLLGDIWGGWINKIWGSSSNDLYIVGNDGNIAHYNGSSWTKIESGTTLNIYDIWGDINPYTNEYEIIALASDLFSGNGTKIFSIKDSDIEEVSTQGLPLSMDAIWFKSQKIYYAVGDGFYSTLKLGNPWIRNYSIPFYYKTAFKGINFNNIFLGGAFGLFMHFNGVEWYNYQYSVTTGNDFFSSIAIKTNIVCTAGARNNNAIVFLGTK